MYSFKTDKNYTYLVYISDQGNKKYEIVFKNLSKHSFDITGTGDAYRVFATVLEICDHFIASNEFNTIFLEAKEFSRQRLYNRLTRIYAKKHNLSLEINNVSGKYKYFLRKKKDETVR